MAIFVKPQNLNGLQLINELIDGGVQITIEDFPEDDGQGNLILNVIESDLDKVAKIVQNHNGSVVPSEPTIDDKLASIGLTIDDLKSALGLTGDYLKALGL